MAPLPKVIRKAGSELTLIGRIRRIAIYREHLLGGNPDHDAYEVILVQLGNTNHKGQLVDPYEGYPAAGSSGKKGWTFTTHTEALQKLEQLVQKASCAGTVGRKNRSDGQGGTRRPHQGPSRPRTGQGRPAKGQAGSEYRPRPRPMNVNLSWRSFRSESQRPSSWSSWPRPKVTAF
jgi:hypothetical protein